MTSRGLYEAVLIELHKENAPNILLEQFNYLANKSINQYVNKKYNVYDVNQQITDDLRVLKCTAILDVTHIDTYNGLTNTSNNATYETILPSDYLHILNCICIYDVEKTYQCYDKGSTWRAAATRLTADMYSQVLDNFWNKPSYKKPYYYIHNINSSNKVPTNPIDGHKGTDVTGITVNTSDGNTIHTATVETNVPNTVSVTGKTGDAIEISNIERTGGIRYGNTSEARLEIRYGTDNRVFKLKKVYIDYLKVPQFVRLTQTQIDQTEDTSQVLEFPDYVCQEIINELVHLVMENIGDQRLQTHPVVSQSVANPAQQQAQEQA